MVSHRGVRHMPATWSACEGRSRYRILWTSYFTSHSFRAAKKAIMRVRRRSHRQNLDHPTLRSTPICGDPVPPLAEQAAIVRFLDSANGRAERAIRAKRKVIALLKEQKQAIIHRAVTRGLDPSVPLKPSGIPWLGDIPQHWEVRVRF